MRRFDDRLTRSQLIGSAASLEEQATRLSPVFSRRQALVGLGLLLAGCGSASGTTRAVSGNSSTSGTSVAPTSAPTVAPAPASTAVPTTVAPTPTATEVSDPDQPPSPTPLPEVEFPTGIEPIRVEIPAIGVDADVIRLDIRGVPEVPENFAEVGWYHQTRLPGEIGPAVLAGHIDSRTGPAVFYRLDELELGAEITVTSAQTESRTFLVIGSGQYSKDALPAEVFGFGEAEPELRLITCGGTFDSAAGHYRDNFVVYAKQV